MYNSLPRILLILIITVAAGLACNLPGSAPTLPPTAVPMNPEDVQNLEQQLQATLNNPNASGEVTVTLTQDQLNRIIAGQIAQQPDQGISDPSVVLTNGQMQVFGKVTQSDISANLQVVLQPTVDAAGNPRLNVVSINLGGLPVPDVLKSRVETMANDALDNYLASTSNSFKVRTITITEGQMAVTGTRQ
ncbi:MAG: DUF2140 family protein [Chloroflexi bacterium]|nr:MAG: DUF2140 family protein [Chloroflexota bacterium]